MNITSIEVYRYALPLVEAMRIKDSVLATRSGLLVKVTGSDGGAGYGEMAPLPAYSPDTLDDAVRETAALAATLTGQPIPEGIERLDGGFDAWIGDSVTSPSVRFGFELAILNLLAAERGVPLRSLLVKMALDEVPVGGLLSGNLGEIRKKAEFLKNEGYKAAKLKVGRYDLATDVQTTRWLCEHFADDMIIRLDANRAWDFDTACRFVQETAGCPIEYIEEPIDQTDRLGEFAQVSGLGVALDESLQQTAFDGIQSFPNLKAVVLKPMVLGLEKSFRMGRFALEQNVRPVISSTYESGFGLCALAQLAAAVQPLEAHAGLDTYEWFDADLLRVRPPLRRPVLPLAELEPFAASFDEARLQKLENA